MRKIKVLIVEDSYVFRELLVRCLRADPMLEVVATATNPYEARDAIIKFSPDVMTLDVEMPRMSGIEFLRKLMPQHPLPTVMISSLSSAVFDALEAGAVEFVNKPSGLNADQLYNFMSTELATKIKIASTVKVGKLKKLREPEMQPVSVAEGSNIHMVAIGASTGGTEAIYDVVKQFNRDIPGVVIVQHMPPGFTKMYADRLNNQCRVAVKEAETGDIICPGQVLIAPGDAHMKVVKVGKMYKVECAAGEKVNGHCPSVDVLFDSVAKVVGDKAVGVILTGMGADGAKGLLNMKKSGALTVGQDEPTCIVYGMPKAAYDIGAVDYQQPLQKIPQRVYDIINMKNKSR